MYLQTHWICLYSFLFNNYGSRYEDIPCCNCVMKWYLSHFCYCITAEPYFRTQERQLCRGRSPIGEPRVNAGGNPRRSCDPSQQADRVGSDRYAWVDVRATSPFHCLEYKAEGCVIVRIFFRETKNADAHQLMDENYHLYVSKLMKNRILSTLWNPYTPDYRVIKISCSFQWRRVLALQRQKVSHNLGLIGFVSNWE